MGNILYKYAGPYGITVLETLKIKVTPPNEFNDPFELTPRSHFPYSRRYLIDQAISNPEQFRTVYEQMVVHDKYPYDFGRFTADLPIAISKRYGETARLLRKRLVELDLNSVHDASREIGILCLSKTPSDICMWGHYADCHRGLVLGLDFSYWEPSVCRHGAVRYVKNRIRIDPRAQAGTREWENDITNVVFRKSDHWSYEQEYRYVIPLAELSHDHWCRYFLHIDSQLIRQVVFGCSAPSSLIEQVRALRAQRPQSYGHLDFFHCERHPSKFCLNVVPIR